TRTSSMAWPLTRGTKKSFRSCNGQGRTLILIVSTAAPPTRRCFEWLGTRGARSNPTLTNAVVQDGDHRTLTFRRMSRDHNDMVAVVAAVDVSNGKVGFEYCRLECHNLQYGTLLLHGTGPQNRVEQSPEHEKLLAPYGKAIT